MHRIFIGYDPPQDIVYKVLRHSLEKHAAEPLDVRPIDASELTEFNRPVDPLASTPFTYTRFSCRGSKYEGTELFTGRA